MINPNEKEIIMAEVIEIKLYDDGTLKYLTVDTGDHQFESVLGMELNGAKVHDIVRCNIGYRITTDRYVLESIKVVAKYKGVS
jgi:hypothetical protein